jgi:hypothetical protein
LMTGFDRSPLASQLKGGSQLTHSNEKVFAFVSSP